MVFNPTCTMIKRPTNLTPKAPARLTPVRLSQDHQEAEKGLETKTQEFSLATRTKLENKSSSGTKLGIREAVLSPVPRARRPSSKDVVCEIPKLQTNHMRVSRIFF